MTEQEESDVSTSEYANAVSRNERVLLEPVDAKRLAVLVGPYDQNLKQIEKRMSVNIRNRGNEFKVSGRGESVSSVVALLIHLYEETAGKAEIEPELVHMSMQESGMEELVQVGGQNSTQLTDRKKTAADELDEIGTYKRNIRPRGKNQKKYVHEILCHDVSFGIGPAGTGKTYLAVACAVNALMSNDVSRILLVRPAVEAGEKLGFLPSSQIAGKFSSRKISCLY